MAQPIAVSTRLRFQFEPEFAAAADLSRHLGRARPHSRRGSSASSGSLGRDAGLLEAARIRALDATAPARCGEVPRRGGAGSAGQSRDRRARPRSSLARARAVPEARARARRASPRERRFPARFRRQARDRLLRRPTTSRRRGDGFHPVRLSLAARRSTARRRRGSAARWLSADQTVVMRAHQRHSHSSSDWSYREGSRRNRPFIFPLMSSRTPCSSGSSQGPPDR